MSTKTVGLIDNLQDIPSFVANRYETASAADVMAATGGNTGNVAFVYGARKIIGNTIKRIEWDTPAEVINREVDHIVICCANQLGSHVDLGSWADKLATVEKPVTLIGLGAQAADTTQFPTIPEGTHRFLKIVQERRAGKETNIAVRGQFTADFLDSMGIGAAPIGCPSLHISPARGLGKKILSRQAGGLNRIAVAAGNPWHGPSAKFERKLVEIVNRWSGEYIIQHPISMLRFAYGERWNIDEKTRSRFAEVYNLAKDDDSLFHWFRRSSSIYVDAPTWMRGLSKFDLIIGPRYHGVALGLQAGVPGCVYTIDSRTEELCSGTGVKCISLPSIVDLDVEEILQMSIWTEGDAEKFDQFRANCVVQTAAFLESNKLSPSAHVQRLMQTAPLE